MDCCASRALTLLARRCLRRQLHSGLEKKSRISQRNLSSVECVVDEGRQQESLAEKLLELELSRYEGVNQLCMNGHVGLRSHRLLGQIRARYEGSSMLWSSDMDNGSRWRIQPRSSEKILAGYDNGALNATSGDFFARYLQWQRYGHVAHLQSSNFDLADSIFELECESTSAAAVIPVDSVDVMVPVTRQNWSSEFPRFLTFPSTILHQEVPLEASSVKRKRKKKMNKHKQRKLRRRDRYRN